MVKTLSKDFESQMDAIVEGLPSKSAKIRALAEAGYERADIARYLGIRYQHVRNVLVHDEARKVSPRSDKPVPITVGPAGRVVIPAACRQALGLKEGDTLMLRLEGGELRAVSRDKAIRDIQRRLAERVPPGTSPVGELLEERRREARQESEYDDRSG